jgi:hypothetical protein
VQTASISSSSNNFFEIMGPKKRKKIKQSGGKHPPVTSAQPTQNIPHKQPPNSPHSNTHSSQPNHETLFKFIEAGGKKCYELFQYLSSSPHWLVRPFLPALPFPFHPFLPIILSNFSLTAIHRRKYGTLPPLSDEEAAMLNHMYQLWLQHQENEAERGGGAGEDDDNESEEKEGTHHYDDSHESVYHTQVELKQQQERQRRQRHEGDDDEDDDDDNDDDDDHTSSSSTSSLDNSQGLSVSSCVATIKETLMNHLQYSDTMQTLLSQLDLLMKSSEPCRTQTSDLIEILMLPEFLDREINSLEKMFGTTETHSGYISACNLALGLLAESEHLLSSSLPSYESYLMKEEKTHISHDQYYDSIALSYYMKSNLFATPLEFTLPHGLHSSTTKTKNSIACMLLGALFLRGGGGAVVAAAAATTTTGGGGGGAGATVDLPPPVGTSTVESVISSEGSVEVMAHVDTLSELTFAANYQTAFDYYQLSAVGHNPIAQHKYV